MNAKSETPRELLTPASLHVLLSLADGKRHGYGIKLDVEERTNGALRLGAGTLYEAIHRIERNGWIEEAGSTEKGGRGKPRKYYRLTKQGRSRLKEELERLRDIVQYARTRDLLPETRR